MAGDSRSSTSSSSSNFQVTKKVTSPGFRAFLSLPTELRLNIWALSIEPRIVEVRFGFKFRSRDYSHKFLNPIPAVLHASSESRRECLKYYQLSQQHSHKSPVQGSQGPVNRFYFNYEIDTLYIPADVDDGQAITIGEGSACDLLFRNNECGILNKIQRIALDGHETNDTTARYFFEQNALLSIVLVSKLPVPCFRDHLCERKGPWCCMKFSDLKANLEDEKNKRISWVDTERVGMARRERYFQHEWRRYSGKGLLCPEVLSRVLCRKECFKE